MENNGSVTRVGTFPIGIDPERFTRSLETDEVQSHIAKLLNRYAGRKVGGMEHYVWGVWGTVHNPDASVASQVMVQQCGDV